METINHNIDAEEEKKNEYILGSNLFLPGEHLHRSVDEYDCGMPIEWLAFPTF